MAGRTTRRRYLVTAVGAGITGLAGCTGGGTDEGTRGTATSPTESPDSSGSVDGEWPMYRADAANTGTLDTTGPTESVTEQWRFDLDELVWSAPAVVDSTVYIGCDDENLYALDARSGSEQWRFEADNRVQSAPAVADGTVYVGSDDDNLYAIDADTGNEQWSFDTSESVKMAPAVADDTVYVGVGNISAESGVMYAIDATTGDKRWQFETDKVLHTSPAVADGTLYFGTGVSGGEDHKLYALDGATGDMEWTYSGAGAFSYPVVVDGTVYVAVDELVAGLVAIDASTGEETESYGPDVRANSKLVVGAGYIYVTNGETLLAVPEDEYSAEWEFETGGNIWGGLLLVDGTLYFGSIDGSLYAVDAESGTQQWAYETGDSHRVTPAVVDGTVYVGGHDGAVYALSEQ
ncbi:PQQ-binding-like beta-propeller repeat protein [Haloarcula rara]|uniref:outer membrane protein assembly factor BamB family protein n=2 Tax=Haloarcula TaxID=2237 RepID=UPI0023E8F3C3|nr:PQQ-binding-like beta-propeller repeat protein [Halomicroarcula sp. SHR3]